METLCPSVQSSGEAVRNQLSLGGILRAFSSVAIDCGVKPVDRDCVGAHDYYRGRVASRVKRCLDLSSHLLAGNERSIWAKKGVKKKQDNLGDLSRRQLMEA